MSRHQPCKSDDDDFEETQKKVRQAKQDPSPHSDFVPTPTQDMHRHPQCLLTLFLGDAPRSHFAREKFHNLFQPTACIFNQETRRAPQSIIASVIFCTATARVFQPSHTYHQFAQTWFEAGSPELARVHLPHTDEVHPICRFQYRYRRAHLLHNRQGLRSSKSQKPGDETPQTWHQFARSTFETAVPGPTNLDQESSANVRETVWNLAQRHSNNMTAPQMTDSVGPPFRTFPETDKFSATSIAIGRISALSQLPYLSTAHQTVITEMQHNSDERHTTKESPHSAQTISPIHSRNEVAQHTNKQGNQTTTPLHHCFQHDETVRFQSDETTSHARTRFTKMLDSKSLE